MTTPSPETFNRIPLATYRLQLRSGFGFREVSQLIDYLQELAISDLYLSPLFRSRRDSSHGYDVVDHSRVEADFGDLNEFRSVARMVRNRGMGILLDIVPNHMGINDPGNKWWNDVLENGELSKFAKNFDIDWDRQAENLRHKVLLPVLGDHFGRELEQGRLQLSYSTGRFWVNYYAARYPISPFSWPKVLEAALQHLAAEGNEASAAVEVELRGIANQLAHLPSKTDRDLSASEERYRSQRDAADRLEALFHGSPEIQEAIHAAITEINGSADSPNSFDLLEQLLDEQWYRLAYWRVAADEINYRRFFDINDLAAIRVEDPEVFEAVHQLAGELVADDLVTGFRIDHPDGLLDPYHYFQELQKLYRHRERNGSTRDEQFYVVVEKILTGEEPLPSNWPVAGTTGYELLTDLNRLLVCGDGLATLREAYPEITGLQEAPSEIIYRSKKQILAESMASELNMLAGHLHRLTQRHRLSRDFTYPSLQRALAEMIACFPVYRTYVPPRGWDVDDTDFGRIMTAVRYAKLRNPTMDWTTLDFIASILLLQYPAADQPDREDFRYFVLKFQQVTGPVTAKGVEDTTFYRYYPLAALNEVGGEIGESHHPVDAFHRRMMHRAADWPHGLSATATHDTKRGEDVRARLLVLTEIPEIWIQTVQRWQEVNRRLIRGDEHIPSANEAYLLYQTLVGTWPLTSSKRDCLDDYRKRILEYMQKALREAKVSTTWANPAEDYESDVLGFVENLLDTTKSQAFLDDLDDFVQSIGDAGFVNGLSQVVLKATVPGAPDFYQGTEFWDFNLVDPDNRRPVDYGLRKERLLQIKAGFDSADSPWQQELSCSWPSEDIKMFVTWRVLQARAEFTSVFQSGEYIPLSVSGDSRDHVLAFARKHGVQWVVVAIPLHVQRLARVEGAGAPKFDWSNTSIELPEGAPRRWLDTISHRQIGIANDEAKPVLKIAELMSVWPVCVLEAAETN